MMKSYRITAVCSFLGILCATGPSAFAEKEVLTAEHVAKIRSVASARISPDGRFVAYTLIVPRIPFKDKDGGAWTELHVVGPNGVSRPFISGKVNIGSIGWTPDGKGISFLAKRGDDDHRSLYVIPVDGGEAGKVVEHDASISSYSWSGDGKLVAFIAKEKEDKDLKKQRDKGFKQEIYEEDYRVPRVWIAGIGDDADEPRPLELDGSPSELHWNPVDNRLVLALAPTPLIDDYYMRRKVFVVDSESGKILTRIDNPGKLGPIKWSPDGKHLAMISAEDLNDPAQGRLMVVPATGGSLTDLIPGYLGHVTSIEWQDAESVMYLGDEGVFTTIAEIGRDGKGAKMHIPVGEMAARGLSLSNDGQSAAFLISSPTHPRELFIMRHGEKSPTRLTHSNPWLDDVHLARQEVVTFSARDGLELQGILIRPLDEETGKRYPLLLTVHGGPEAHDANDWRTRYSSPGQVAAAKGFAVFYPNYRGSTGRGVEFSKLGQADYAGKEFDDLVDAVDHLIAIGLVDKDKVGITGGSYGGFATAWCSTYYSHRFKAGVMFVGISDHVSKSGTTDIPNEMYEVHARKKLYDSWDFFRERSPLYHVEKGKTPLVILHGKDDPRVHPSQSMELYRHLKILGQTPVRLVWYPGEGHGNRKAAARYDYSLRMMRWFEHYLKGSGGEPPAYELEYGLADEHDDNDK